MPDLTIVAPEPDEESGAEEAAKPEPAKREPVPRKKKAPAAPATPWPDFIKSASTDEIQQRFSDEAKAILSKDPASRYCTLALLEPEDSINQFDLDQVYVSLSRLNAKKDKDVLLILLSRGGTIEPAYQISKICKAFSKQRFVVCVPRQAKSAATLVALGADEIHMGPLGHLGPIDPQLGGLPALGVSQALETLAKLSEKYQGSSDMFARYLRMALTVEQIGYYDRICESAEQYAVRLLSTKPQLVKNAGAIAHELVHEYKDHGFVIDLAEAQQHLGADWIKSGTGEVAIAEEIYRLFEMVNLFIGFAKKTKILVLGSFDENVYTFPKQTSQRA